MIEAFCISYFSLEFFIRLAVAPNKIGFLKGTMNIVDVLAIAPYYLTLFLIPAPNIDLGKTLKQQLQWSINVINIEAAAEANSQGQVQEEESGFGNAGRIMQV